MRTRILTLILLFGFSSLASATDIELQDGHPDRYVVVKGDTLWGISGRFLKKPWRWPEIWRMNREEIKNPHWIYPGDVIVLERIGGKPYLRLERGAPETVKLSPRVREEPIERAIPSVPAAAIEPFLSKPLVIEAKGLETAPYIIGTSESRVILGVGDSAYVQGIKEGDPRDWQIYRPGRPLVDPDTGEVLGYEATYLGDARITGNTTPAGIEITRSVQEINVGDRLVPKQESVVNAYVPHPPEQPVKGRIISAYGGVAEVGQNGIVTLNRGTRDGLEVGTVLAVSRHGRDVRAIADNEPTGETVRLPDEQYGLLFVFRTFERLSYALVVQATRPVHVLDDVQNP
jgi:hypothetical protein